MGIGSILVEKGLISEPQLSEALAEQRRTGERLDRALVRLGLVGSGDLLAAIGQQLSLPVVDLGGLEVEDEILRMLPPKLVFRQRCVPIGREHGVLRVATCDPFELGAIDELQMFTGMSIELALADERDLAKFIRQHYGVAGDTLDALGAGDTPTAAAVSAAESDEAEQAHEASVVKLVNDLLVEAIRERATDVHIEPYEHMLAIRYRIDGVLSQAGVPPTVNRFRNAIVSRLKIMSNLNIAEKRKPQDGRITLRQRGEEYDLRLSIIPMLHGEGVVLRILSKSAVLMGLEELGMPQPILVRWDDLIRRPHGILLVTGPTGSGKSTTLYASLRRIVSDEVKAITVEDPVEYHVDGVNQIQVNHQVGLDFASGLRAILRHDPDIIMIGEIRDRETADAAVQASLTGHLVFSTLHTNDAAGATTRLLDMGVEPFLVASSVEGIMAQRLLRRICVHCRRLHEAQPHELPPEMRDEPGLVLQEGAGCRECRGTGYRGRFGVYELLRMTERTREMVMERANASQLAVAAQADGELNLLRDAALEKVREGVTTVAEAMRATKG
ncbi:MAG: type II/IV secretion system protein [Phycisphaerales bacterium]|nr:type II/IV secretion system protein [Phycisphaerales bacterium]